jgi:hypothetical protein
LEKKLTDNPPLSRSILGTADPREVRHDLDAYGKKHLGSKVEEVLFFQLSTGAAFGLLLSNGHRILLKAHPPERPAEYLEAVHRVQDYLYRRGFPCPEPLIGPLPFSSGLATVDEFADRGELPNGHDPKVRREVAETLARQIELAGEAPDIRGLEKGWPWPKKDELWPPPHNALFDFEATGKGAGWIDETAARAKAIVDDFDGRIVVGHTDWSADQIRLENGKVSVVYDWDSLRPEKEVVIVGIAASNFTSTWSLGIPNPPSPAETRLFVEDYEKARGGRFSEAEREAIAAAAIYAIAYIARCEHAVGTEGKGFRGSFREALPLHRDDCFGEV